MSALETSPGPINPPPPPPAIGARLFTRTLSDSGEVCWVPARPDRDLGVRGMLVEIPDAVKVWKSSNLVAGELVELVGDLQRITLQSGNPLEALAPAGWVYVGSVWGHRGGLQMFGRGEAAIRAVAVVLADLFAAGNHPPAPGEQGPVPPIVEVPVELPWLDHEDPPEAQPVVQADPTARLVAALKSSQWCVKTARCEGGRADAGPVRVTLGDLRVTVEAMGNAQGTLDGDGVAALQFATVLADLGRELERDLPWFMDTPGMYPPPHPVELPSMTQPAPSASDVPTVKLPTPSRAEELIAKALASIKRTTVQVDDAGFTVIWGKRDLINPADKHSSDWLTDLLTYLEPTPASEKVILELVGDVSANWRRPYVDLNDPRDDGRADRLDGILVIGDVKLYIGAEFAEFGDALFGLVSLRCTTDDRGPVAPRADDAGMLVEADPVETCAELLAEVLDEAHYAVNSVAVSEHEDESVVVIGPVTFRISAPHFTGGSARVARALGALGEALESRFVARFGETASEE